MPPRKKAKAELEPGAGDAPAQSAITHSPRRGGRAPETLEPEAQHVSKQRRILRRQGSGPGETQAQADGLLHSDELPETEAAQPRLQPKHTAAQNGGIGSTAGKGGRGGRKTPAGRGGAEPGPSSRRGEEDDLDFGPDRTMDAVVKVFCIHCEPNFSLPWQRKRQYSSSSSGFILTGRRILTNAHCVDHHTQVKVKRRGSEEKFVASVLAVGTECDIALLTVEDPKFWEDVECVSFGELPQLQDAVTVVGYPIGGDSMSVTSGVVSRIEVTSYIHGAAELLGVQIDAAINSGNSGGPAFNESGQCVGIAFQCLKHEDAENIGYVIPTPVIHHFLMDYERHNTFTGFPCLGVEWQKMENPDLRRALGMKPPQKGVMVRRLEPTCAAFKLLKPNDILLSFDGTAIANDGTVPFRSGERISFSYLVSQKYTGEDALLEVLQGGVVKTLTVKLQAPVRLVPFHIKNQPPSYFIVAGLVFTAITVPYLRSEYGKEFDFDAPVKLLDKMMHALAQTEDQQVVLLAHVLASEANIGYEDIINTQVASLNGTKVNNLRDVVRIVDSCTDEYLNFDLDYGQKVVLHTQRVRETTKEILTMHCIARDRSADLVLPGAAPVEVSPVVK